MNAQTHDQLIQSAARRFREAGIPDARQNAMLLMLHAFDGTRASLILVEDKPAPEEVAEAYEAFVQRRLAREPLQHILGDTVFYGLRILTDGRALIPRPDSETVVEAALALIPEGEAVSIADLGTGSGCLLAAILHLRPDARGVGVEASREAASLAGENFAALGLTGRASLFEGSWADWSGWEQSDLVISNPPYIASGEIAGLSPEVRAHDPMKALDGGADGLNAYREIVALAEIRLKPGAWLVFEIGYDQKQAVTELLKAADFASIGTAMDLGGNDRAVWARKREN